MGNAHEAPFRPPLNGSIRRQTTAIPSVTIHEERGFIRMEEKEAAARRYT